MSIIAKQLTYEHPDRVSLFSGISFSLQKGDKAALLGDNGTGKSTLLQILAGKLMPKSGEVISSAQPYYIPQHFGQYNGLTIAAALQIDLKLNALQAILGGDASAENFAVLDDDWNIEERAQAALSTWKLDINLNGKMEDLSGGEKTRVFLAGIAVHQPEIILMDEPTNHLDFKSREALYSLIKNTTATLLIVSHDRALLNSLTSIYELSRQGIAYYAGNYEFYHEQKEIELNALQNRIEDKEKELRLARKTAREAIERKQKHEVRGKKQKIKGGVGKMAMDTFQDKAEKSNTKLRDVHENKMSTLAENLAGLQSSLPDTVSMKTDFNSSVLHSGKILVTAKGINYAYTGQPIWEEPQDFQIKSGERVVLRGRNGSGKTTLLKLITGELQPTVGELIRADFSYVFLDQEYSIIDNSLTVYSQAEKFAPQIHDSEIKTILNRFLFPYETWDKPCSKLSGGEKMKLSLCCLMLSADKPDMFILDEPTNNIDIRNVDILTSTICDYKGTVLIVSHDSYFIERVGVDYAIEM